MLAQHPYRHLDVNHEGQMSSTRAHATVHTAGKDSGRNLKNESVVKARGYHFPFDASYMRFEIKILLNMAT